MTTTDVSLIALLAMILGILAGLALSFLLDIVHHNKKVRVCVVITIVSLVGGSVVTIMLIELFKNSI